MPEEVIQSEFFFVHLNEKVTISNKLVTYSHVKCDKLKVCGMQLCSLVPAGYGLKSVFLNYNHRCMLGLYKILQHNPKRIFL